MEDKTGRRVAGEELRSRERRRRSTAVVEDSALPVRMLMTRQTRAD